MATTTHTIKINENPHIRANTVSAKRVSKSRAYAACVVATATEKTVADLAIGLADHEARVAELTPAVDAVLKANGYEDAKAFEAALKAAHDAWHGPRAEVGRKISEAVEAATGKRMHFLTDAEREQADRETEALGLVNPYGGTMSAITTLVRKLAGHVYSVAQHKKQNVQVGDQLVVTWSRTAALAHKALPAHAKWYGPRGYTLAVRTDIEVTTK